MGKLRYEYNLGEIERGESIEDQAVAEDQLKELAEWQKQVGQRIRIQERESEGGTKWIKGLPSRNKGGADEKKEMNEGGTEKEKEKKTQENNSWQGWQDWSEWKKEPKKTEESSMARGKKRARSAEWRIEKYNASY